MDRKIAPVFFLYLFLITYLSSIPNLQLQQVFNYQDLILHFVEYSILAFLTYFSFPEEGVVSNLLFIMIFAFLDELHQYFVPGRSFSFLDFLADFIGAFCCLIAIIKYKENLFGEGS